MLRIILSFLLTLIFLSPLPGPGLTAAEVPADLAAVPLVAKLVYSESYRDKLKKYKEEGDVWYEVVSAGSFRFRAAIPAAANNIPVANITGDTEFRLQIGNLPETVFTPSQDPKYKPGRTSAKIILKDYNDNDRLVTYLSASLSWSANKVSLAVSGKTPAFLDPPLAYDFMEIPGPISAAVLGYFGVTIGDFDYTKEYTVTLSGKTKVKQVVKTEEQFDLYTITLSGSGS